MACAKSRMLVQLALILVSPARIADSTSANFVCVGKCSDAALATGTCCLGSDGEEQCYADSLNFDGPVVFGGSRRLAKPDVISGNMKVCQDFAKTSESADVAPPNTGTVDDGDTSAAHVITPEVTGVAHDDDGEDGDGIHFKCVGACTDAPLAAGTCCTKGNGDEECEGGSKHFDKPVVFGGDRRLSQFGTITGNMNICSVHDGDTSAAHVTTQEVVGVAHDDDGEDGDGTHFKCVGACTDTPLAAGTCCTKGNDEEECEG